MTSINATSPASSPSSQAGQQLNVNYQNFLKLLTAQISNQDPLAPMESTEFVSQLAQLSQVEQSIQTNTNLESISAAMAADAAKSDLELLGHEVLLQTDHVALGSNGASLGYTLSAEATQVVMTIRDGNGAVIRNLTGPSGAAGELHHLDWDGLSNAGQPVEQGIYSLSVSAMSNEGETIAGQPFAYTEIEAISFENGVSLLQLANGTTGISSDVVKVREHPES